MLILLKEYGGNALLSKDKNSDHVAMERGMNPIKIASAGIASILQQCGIPTSKEFLPLPTRFETIEISTLSPEKRKIYENHKLVETILEVETKPPKIYSKSFAGDKEARPIAGKTELVTKQPFINEQTLDPNKPRKFYGTFAHEIAHQKSHAPDGSIPFQEELTEYLGTALEDSIAQREKNAQLEKENAELRKKIEDLEYLIEKNK